MAELEEPPGITRTQPVSSLPKADLARCTHKHRILASVVEADRTRPLPTVMLYHCCPEPPPPYAVAEATKAAEPAQKTTVPPQTLAVPLSPDLLAGVQGFADLDTVCLARNFDVAAAVASHLVAAPNVEPKHLVQQLPASEDGTFTQFYTFYVYSDSAEDVFADKEGRVPVWRWAKPASPYGLKAGFWETELQQALGDGAWRGGKELVLLVRRVSEEDRWALAGLRTSSLNGLAAQAIMSHSDDETEE